MSAALSITNLSKTFTGQRVLHEIGLRIERGEIRAIVGQNGSGKSTLVKILAGVYEADPGAEVECAGSPLQFGHDGALRFVHQDLGLVPNLNAVDNLALGHGYTHKRRGRIRWRDEIRSAQEAMVALGYEIDVRRPVGELSISERTAVAVARALSPRRSASRLLVLDEPTANLPSTEANRLFALVRSVRASGVAVLFVSHHLDEIFAIADFVTVLRDGRVVDTRPITDTTHNQLVELIIGRPFVPHEVMAGNSLAGDVVLSARGITGEAVDNIDIDVSAGEIVGIAGITGSGREEIAELLFGVGSRLGQVRVSGELLFPGRPDRAIALGVGLVPAERHTNAAFLDASLRENLTIVDVGRNVVRGLLRSPLEKSDVVHWLDRLQVRPNLTEASMHALSGGNQQKVVLARWLRQAPKVLILDDPTQGVDVGAKAEIHELIEEAAEHNTAILILSSDHDELVRLCHRVLVMRNGGIVDELHSAVLTPEYLTACTVGNCRTLPNQTITSGDGYL